MDVQPSLDILRTIPPAVDTFDQGQVADLPVGGHQEQRKVKMSHPALREKLEMGCVRSDLLGVKKLHPGIRISHPKK
jgi:hypothetical protein